MLEAQRYQEAADAFESGAWRGVSEYLAGDYQDARQSFAQQLAGEASTTADQHYNHGHALARSGQLDAAIAAYDRALALQPDHDNARRAREIVENLKQQQDQQQSQDQQQDNPENSDSDSDPSAQNAEQSPQQGEQQDAGQ